jgi:zinc protease
MNNSIKTRLLCFFDRATRRMFPVLGISCALLAPVLPANAQRVNNPKAKNMENAGATSKAPHRIDGNVLMPNRSPLITFRILFQTGAAYDPNGKEGVAALTASMLANGGSRALPYDQIVKAMYPMASSFGSQTDKEMTVFVGATHVDNLDKFYSLISQMLLDPGFRDDDFSRLKIQAINFLDKSIRNGNDEELGKERLYNQIYSGHPYGHHNIGTISSLQKLTLDDVRDFYRNHYTRSNFVIGLAGAYPPEFMSKMQADFTKLPAGKPDNDTFAQPALTGGTHIDIVQRETRSTALSLGFPIPINRSSKDWAALALVTSFFGEHRSSNSHLYQRLREARGLNYGDYAYIEYFPRGMFRFDPNPNLARQQQIFQIWIRPVEPENGQFVLRAALYELDKLVKDGLTQEEFEATRQFLSKYVNILTASQDAQLGYALDSKYYGIGNFNDHVRRQLASLTLKDVNAAIKRYLASNTMRIAIVTKDAQGLRDSIVSNRPSPISYNSPKPKELTDEDKIIESYKIDVKPENVLVVPVSSVFQ